MSRRILSRGVGHMPPGGVADAPLPLGGCFSFEGIGCSASESKLAVEGHAFDEAMAPLEQEFIAEGRAPDGDSLAPGEALEVDNS